MLITDSGSLVSLPTDLGADLMKKNKKALFIINPYSGKGLIKNHVLAIIDILVKGGYEPTVHTTQERRDAVRVVRERDRDYDLVVCSGGDGTLDEIVTGMMQSGFKTTIGYIPSGSTNDFANSLKLPNNMKKAAEVIVNGEPFSCDVGFFNDDIFVYIAAFGLFTEVSYGTPQEMKNMLGHMAYILEGVKHLQNIKSYYMKVVYKDAEDRKTEHVAEDDFIFGMVTNSLSVGGFKGITGRNVLLNDGLFEVVLIKRPRNPIELNSILTALVSEKFDTDLMYSFKTGELYIETEDEVAWTLDGEFGGKHRAVTLKNKQNAIDIKKQI